MIIKSQSQIKDKDNENGLYLVSTPIGNLKDITLRAIETLKKSSYILCEDTRVSKNLLDRYEIKSRMISNHKFNESKNLNKIISLLKSGEIISLISDAGTPSISDPGSILVNECIKNDIKVTPIPGPSAVATAVSISGFSEKFIFYGFLPEKKQAADKCFQ
jgi:16S rRNA (cytidine1402-2'-O)-methyltransferase